MNRQIEATPPSTYGVKVRDLWVAIDFDAGAVAVTREQLDGSDRTEDLGDGVLIDRDVFGRIIAVEILGAERDSAERTP